MKEKIKSILESMHKYNTPDMAKTMFGLDSKTVYDALVLAPAWKPVKIISDPSFNVTVLSEHSYISSYLVEKDGVKTAWVQTASGGGNLIDSMVMCAELKFKKLIFAGAVGALKADFEMGDLCTPSYCISGTLANTYLKDRLSDFVPFERVVPDGKYIDSVVSLAEKCGYNVKKASVFCTDSVSLEYLHLDEIKAFGTDLIEMETSSFYLMADLLEVPAVALLAVSDNSAAGIPLIGKDEKVREKYDFCKKTVIPDLIFRIAGEK